MYLLPMPRRLEEKSGKYTMSYYGEIRLDISCVEGDYISAKVLQEELQEALGFQWEIRRGNSEESHRGGLICLKNSGVNPQGLPASQSDKELAIESYELHIGENGIEIRGADAAGLWYGVQTLRQILRQEGAVLPQVDIWDGPEIPNRGFYHDSTRCRIPTMEEMKRLVDKLAYYKLNQLQLYVEHTYLFRDFSEVWRDDTPLTAEDIMELDRYCKERHVELVPSLSSFGHLYKLLRTKEYTGLCELPESDKDPFSFVGRMAHHTVDVTNPRSFELVRRLIEEFLPLFTSKYFNVCADETFDLGTGRSKEEGEKVGKMRLYMDFLKQVCQLIVDHGRIPMFWGDIICEFPEAVKELPEGTICLNWGYSPEQGDEETKKLQAAGAIQYLCPGVQGWNNLVNDMKGAYENISRMCRYAVQYGGIGVLNTDWGDYGHVNHPEFSTVGMIYGAAFSWNPEIPEREAINQAISLVEYGDRSGRLVEILTGLQQCSVFSWFYAVIYKEVQEGIFAINHDWYSLDRIPWDRIPEAEEKLSALEQELYTILKELPESARRKMYAYLLAAEGIHLCNRIGQVVRYRSQQEEAGIADMSLHREYPLAADLEHWYRRFRMLWHTVSREAELYRVGQVIGWYGDYLRDR